MHDCQPIPHRRRYSLTQCLGGNLHLAGRREVVNITFPQLGDDINKEQGARSGAFLLSTLVFVFLLSRYRHGHIEGGGKVGGYTRDEDSSMDSRPPVRSTPTKTEQREVW